MNGAAPFMAMTMPVAIRHHAATIVSVVPDALSVNFEIRVGIHHQGGTLYQQRVQLERVKR